MKMHKTNHTKMEMFANELFVNPDSFVGNRDTGFPALTTPIVLVVATPQEAAVTAAVGAAVASIVGKVIG
ncbi:hypothetical protein [Mycetocola spongiae]|uniref:hypothetical protein n=1 Tax=Mycetocola spongiae TaxID=2859226 RepID=UPI001CF513A9|nr:hypothetical protein [Mycetocola spongiae]UCR87902.1 hypothetical protein KXZ72_07680 [Mycetocola spongiae]